MDENTKGAAAPHVVADERAAALNMASAIAGMLNTLFDASTPQARGRCINDARKALAEHRAALAAALAAAPVQADEFESLVAQFIDIIGVTDTGDTLADARSAINKLHKVMAAPVQAQEPVGDIDDAFSIAAAGCMFGNADAVESAKHWFKTGHAMGRGAAVREYIDNGTFPAPVQPVAVPDEPTEEMLNAARDWAVKKYGIGIGNDAASGCWKAMHAAAPAAQGDATPFKWPNGCDRTIPKALRYLARNDRPSGGEDLFNGMHLLQLADEMDAAVQRAAIAAKAANK